MTTSPERSFSSKLMKYSSVISSPFSCIFLQASYIRWYISSPKRMSSLAISAKMKSATSIFFTSSSLLPGFVTKVSSWLAYVSRSLSRSLSW